jgi:hypothetical protein
MNLVAEWRQAWRWFSCQAMALAAAIQGAWAAVPDDMKTRIPDWIVTASTLALLLAGIGGRLVKQQGRAP